MRILILARHAPRHEEAGDLAVIYERITRLAARGHEVGLLAFERDDPPQALAALDDQLLELRRVPPPGWPGALAVVRDRMLRGIPAAYARQRSNAMARALGEMVARSRYEVVLAEYTQLGQHLHYNPYLPAVRRVTCCYHGISLDRAPAGSDFMLLSPRQAVRAWRTQRLRRYEAEVYRAMDLVLVHTQAERMALLNITPDLRISVVPRGIDDVYYQPPAVPPAEKIVLFMGDYADPANVDAVLWFARQIWPRISAAHPAARFYAVGAAAPRALVRIAARDPRIVVPGMVRDLQPYLARAQVFACPIRLGRGIRGKMLIAMAAGVPVVSTTLGLEGIPAHIGSAALVADDPALMARQINLLLDDPGLRQGLAAQARRMVQARFSWGASVHQLEQALLEIRRH